MLTATDMPTRDTPMSRQTSLASISEPVTLVNGVTQLPAECPAEWKAGAEMVGVRDVDLVYAKFKAIHKARPRGLPVPNWADEWELFYVREKGYQRRDRERSGPKRATVQELDGSEPWAKGLKF